MNTAQLAGQIINLASITPNGALTRAVSDGTVVIVNDDKINEMRVAMQAQEGRKTMALLSSEPIKSQAVLGMLNQLIDTEKQIGVDYVVFFATGTDSSGDFVIAIEIVPASVWNLVR